MRALPLNGAALAFMAQKYISNNLLIYSNNNFDILQNKSHLKEVFTDFCKAFDQGNHDILLSKISEFGLTRNFCN